MTERLRRVQERFGVPQTGVWDPNTDGGLLAFQQAGVGQVPMAPHGHPDAATLVNAGYYEPGEIFRRGWVDYLDGGSKPGNFTRDIATAIDQVPRWAWAVTASVLGVVSYLAYRADQRRAA